MPLNATQLEKLFSTADRYVETILQASKINSAKQIEWLQLSISDTKLTIEDTVQLLKQNPALTKGLTNVNVPNEVRNSWRQLITIMRNNEPIPDDLLKELSKFNNYNPLLMAEMRLFENKINAVPELSVIKDALLRLREAYLEMTPLVSSSYGGHARAVCFRLGVPFDLDKLGSPPSKGEIQKEIKQLVQNKLKKSNQDQKEIDEKDELEGTAALVFKEAEKVLGTQVLLGEMTEQQKCDLFKQEKSSAKRDRLLRMQPVLLNLDKRITQMMDQATANMSKIDMALNESKAFVEQRVSECCQELLGVQKTMVEECFKAVAFNETDFNKCYQEQLQTAYEMFLNDMVGKWTENRERWLSEGVHFSTVAEKFKAAFEKAMESKLKKFRSLYVKSLDELNKLRNKLPTRMDEQASKVTQYRKNWDNAVMPLMELADKCNELRRLRSQIPQNEYNLEAFNNVVTALSKVRHGLGVSEIDEGGFNLLHYACWGGNLRLVQDLLAQGVSAVLNDSEGNCILHLAVENDTKDTVAILEILMKQPLFSNISSVLELKTKLDKTPLHVAATVGNVTALQWVLGTSQTGKPLALLDLEVEADPKRRMTPLHYAAREGQEGVVDCLLVWRAGRSIRHLDNNHPLVLAIQRGHFGVVHSFCREGIWLTPTQKEYLLKMAQESAAYFLKIYYCLTIIPKIETLNTELRLARLKPALTAANSPSITAAPSTPVPVAGDQSAFRPSQSIAAHLDISVLTAVREEPSAEQVEQTEQTEQAGQNLLFDYSSGTTRGRSLNATPSADADATPPVNARTTATATL